MIKSRLNIFLFILMIVLIFSGCKKPASKGKNREKIFEGYVIKKTNVVKEYKYPVILEAFKKYDIKAKVSGQVLKIYKYEGSYVRKDETICKIDDFNYRINLEKAKSSIEELEVNLKMSYLKYKNDSILYSKKKISKFQYLNSLSTYKKVKNLYKTTLLNIKNLEKNLSYTNVKPLYSGYLTKRYVNEGDFVNMGMPLFRIVNLSKLIANVYVSEDVIKYIKSINSVFIILDSDTIKGKIFSYSREIDPQTLTYSVEVMVDNRKYNLFDGVSGTLYIQLKNYKNVAKIKEDNVLKENGKFFVFLYENGKSIKKEINIIDKIGEYYLTNDLNNTDTLIISNIENLRDNLPVKVKVINSI